MNTVIAPSTTLADLVTAHPDLAGELERRLLDYCCGGQRTLAEACRDRGLDPAAIARELVEASTAASPSAWTTLDAAALVDHLEATHHAYLHAELPRLSALSAKVRGVHGAAHPELEAVASEFEELRAELEPHLMKEERVLFPLIRQLVADPTAQRPMGLAAPISQMLREHDQAGALLEQLRSTTTGYAVPSDGCASYHALYRGLEALEADTHLHVHIENNRLFPMVTDLESQAGRSAAGSGG
jgi:regulator of cell morphogenesis and NO signaling